MFLLSNKSVNVATFCVSMLLFFGAKAIGLLPCTTFHELLKTNDILSCPQCLTRSDSNSIYFKVI